MCPQNYHRESLTVCKHGGNRTLTLRLIAGFVKGIGFKLLGVKNAEPPGN
jgi:hypothetical protein